MDPNTQRLMMGAAGAAEKIYIEDVFSTWLYTGTGNTRTIANGIDLAGKGGLVWIKGRDFAVSHTLFDTERGVQKYLSSDTTASQTTLSTSVTSFNSAGFSMGSAGIINANGQTYASWTFRKQAKFFTVVTYTGNGSNRTIAHDLGSVPGCIIVKRTDTTGDWQVYHRSLANTEYMVLNSTAAKATGATRWNSTTPTDSVFSIGTDAEVNANNGTYVAYLFAHNAGGFGNSGNDSVISCGSYTGNGSSQTINCGFTAGTQFVLIKRTDSTSDWLVADTARGIVSGNDPLLRFNTNDPEVTTLDWLDPNNSGFVVNQTATANINVNSASYIYLAIA